MGKSDLLDLEKQFALYGAHHRNHINYFLHLLLVWPIFFSALVLLYFTPTFFQFEFSPFGKNLSLNFGFFCASIYSLFYISLDKKAGSLAALLSFLSWVGGSLLASQLGYSLAWKVVLATQLFCTTGLVIGHVFERRATPILENLIHVFVMESFFIFLEALQTFCAYEPYLGFNAKVQEKIDAQIKDFQEPNQKKIS
ncbi:putative ER membrane protein [Thalictrum thalictroides]|uniref:Putative ER membrane protein n=1 Tax=Thalictrum thalictroides TaxID=46969 RepID=A0A7J6V154_THATH|nr:putative ER membrane protein [Thalictrum thalictroides]